MGKGRPKLWSAPNADGVYTALRVAEGTSATLRNLPRAYGGHYGKWVLRIDVQGERPRELPYTYDGNAKVRPPFTWANRQLADLGVAPAQPTPARRGRSSSITHREG